MTHLKWRREYLHKKWQKRYDRAWSRACYKANNGYHEDICACSPEFYFFSELAYSKKLPREFYIKHDI